jgi:hypothetical protein
MGKRRRFGREMGARVLSLLHASNTLAFLEHVSNK